MSAEKEIRVFFNIRNIRPLHHPIAGKEPGKCEEEITHAYCNCGNEHLRKGNYTQALRDSTAAIEIYPRYAKAYYGRAKAYDEKRLHAASAEDFQKACDLGDKDACRAFER